jgi:hypothetical protein
MRRTGIRIGWALTMAWVLAAVVCCPPWTRADEVEGELEQFREPIDAAIDLGLEYLADSQERSGEFPSPGLRGNSGVTALGVMAFLSKGYTPGTGPYGKTINRGVDYVLGCQQGNGLLISRGASHGPMYSHGICTLMLSEVSGMVDPNRQARIDKALPKALRLILAAQAVKKNAVHEGGWRYKHNSNDSDLSCTGWQLMALRSARGNGAEVPAEAIRKAVSYVLKCRHDSGAFCYQGAKRRPGLERTGTGLLCLELTGRHDDEVTRQAGEYILQNIPDRFGHGGHFYYGLYYCSQGMFQLGGKYWQQWALRMYTMALKHQDTKEGSRHYGAWPPGPGGEGRAGRCYSTAMTILAIGVSYRQLPIYQR